LSEDHGTVTVEQPPAPDETDSPVTSSTTTRRAARFQRHQRVVLASVLAGGALVITGGVVAANVGLGADGSSAAGAAIVEPVDRDGAAARSVAERLSLDEDGAQTTYTVEVDGETFTFTSSQDTLAAALADAGIQVGPDDEVSAPLNGPVTDVVITRVNADTVTEEEIDAHETIEQETDELYEGETRVQTEGVDGRVVNTYRVTSAGGEETGRELVASVAVDERVDEVVLVGTREREPVQAAPAQEETESTPAPSTEEPAVAEEPETTETAPTYTGGDPRGIDDAVPVRLGRGPVLLPQHAVEQRVRLEPLGIEPELRRVRDPAGPAGQQDGSRRRRLAHEPGHADLLGPRLHLRPLRHPLRRALRAERPGLVLTGQELTAVPAPHAKAARHVLVAFAVSAHAVRPTRLCSRE
jgi:hypothetical protein